LNGKSDNDYYPVKLVETFSLDNLPTEEEFVNAFKEEEEEQDA
jgi:hypothetical protein